MLAGIYDMHCHLVPGVDDGAATPEDSMALIRAEYAGGVRHLIVTPHFRREMFEADRDFVEHQFRLVRTAARKEFPDLTMDLGCEFHVNMEMPELVREDARYRMAGSFYVLAEFSGPDPESYIIERVRALLSHGYTPIIAHAERYGAVFGNFELIRRLRQTGALIQINADSVIGKEGRGVKKFCRRLIDEDLLDFVGSDAHNMKTRPVRIGECADYLCRKYGEDYAEDILIRNPSKILAAAQGRRTGG